VCQAVGFKAWRVGSDGQHRVAQCNLARIGQFERRKAFAMAVGKLRMVEQSEQQERVDLLLAAAGTRPGLQGTGGAGERRHKALPGTNGWRLRCGRARNIASKRAENSAA
jgi:hypothetical protein